MATAKRQASEQGALAIRLFGHTEMNLDGAPFKFATPRKSLQVLAYLLLHRSAPVTREYLAFVLFPDEEESVARTKLRSTLGDMSKILPAPLDRYVSIDGENVTWNANAPLWLDVDAFVEAAADPVRLDEAIELYRGDLLPQLYDEWLETARDQHRNTYLRCLSEAVSAARRKADFGHAIETARKILAVDPWREDIVRRIIAMRYESGDRAGALNEYLAFSQRLRVEMNTAPMSETAAIAERVRRGLELPNESDDVPRLGLPVKPVLPFVGRESELDALLEAWSGVARGRGTVAFLGGEPGIGKSRLAMEFAHLVEDRGGRVLVGSTSFPEAVAYESVTDALRSALPLIAALKPDQSLAALTAIVPEIRGRIALPELPRLEPESERIRLFDGLARVLAQLAAQRPLLLLIEDLHWAGAATHDLLQFLLRRIAGTRIMVLATYRDDETPRAHPLQRLRNEAQATLGAQNFWLRRLSDADVTRLWTNLPDSHGPPVEKLVSASQGHPHLLTQLVLDFREDTTPQPSTDSIGTLLTRRIERLSAEARTVAEIAACIGDHFSRDALREVSAWDDTALSDALDELLDRRIVREASGRGLFEYAFTHHAVQEAIAGEVAPQRDMQRRRRVARVLEELYPERAGELAAMIARHYDLAGDAPNAARRYLDAVRHSIVLSALEEAREQCSRGVELAADPRLRVELLLESATIESRRGEPARWNEILTELERADAALGDVATHRLVLLHRIQYARTCWDQELHAQTVAELKRSVDNGDLSWKAKVLLAELFLAFDFDQLADASAAGERALECSRAAGDDETATRILSEMAVIEAHRGHVALAEGLFKEAREAAARTRNRVIELLPLRSAWTVAYQRRDAEGAVALARQILELTTALADRPSQGRAHDALGVAITATGTDLAVARRHFAIALELLEESGQIDAAAGSLLNLSVLETRVGFFERGMALAERALKIFSRHHYGRGRIVSLENLAFLRAYTGDIDGAREAAQEVQSLAATLEYALSEASALENLAFTEARAGNFERALELAEASFEKRAQTESQVWSCKTLADAAIWHARLGDLPAARENVRRMLSDEESIVEATDFPTYCYWAAAQIFHLDGRDGDAARALDKARRLLQSTAGGLEGEDRAQYLSIPWNADMMAAAESGQWPKPPR